MGKREKYKKQFYTTLFYHNLLNTTRNNIFIYHHRVSIEYNYINNASIHSYLPTTYLHITNKHSLTLTYILFCV